MKTLGIITTTYNRGYCIHQVYESLVKQECKDFMWLVIDDGSTDNTKEIIQKFIDENKIEIEYIYHDNMGMTASRNVAYENIKTKINTIIDSDDWLEDDAISKIINFWEKNNNKTVAGIIALNKKTNGNKIGKNLPNNVKQCTFTDLEQKYKCGGDKKFIYRSDISRKYSYPRFENENYFPASYKFSLIDLDYEMLLMNEYVCIVDINETGATFNRVNQYKTCAKGFAFYRNEMMRIWKRPLYIAKSAIHYISASKFAKDKYYIRNASNKKYVILCLPIGLLFHKYLQHTKRKSLKHKIGN